MSQSLVLIHAAMIAALALLAVAAHAYAGATPEYGSALQGAFANLVPQDRR